MGTLGLNGSYLPGTFYTGSRTSCVVLVQCLVPSSHGSAVFLGVPPLDTMPPLAGTLAAPGLQASLRPPMAQSHCFLMRMVILVNAFRMALAETLLRHP